MKKGMITLKPSLILLCFPFIFLLSEIFFRYLFDITPLGKYLETYFIFFLFIFFFSYAKWKTTRFIISILFYLSLITNNIHYEIYQNWINSINYLLMFKELTEVTHAGIGMVDKILPATIYALVESAVFILITSFISRKNIFDRKFVICDILFLLIFIFMIVRSFFSSSENVTTNLAHSRVKSHFYSVSVFLGKVLPYDLLNLSDLPKYTHPTPEIISQPKAKNIILIIGESLSAKHVNYFGYHRETMPFLTELAKNNVDKNLLLKETYSAGVLTALSVPALLSAIPYPNGVEQIMKGDTNIFNLARRQGYETYFYTSQPEKEMSLINLMGKNWMQHKIMPTQLGEDISRGMNDHRLVPLLKDIDLDKGNNFIVLQQRGSHTNYGEYLSEDEKIFKNGTPLDNYDSTVYNTDQFIRKIYEYLASRNKDDYLLIYTSDHGQLVTEKTYNQGTMDEEQYIVPAFIYTKNKEVMENMGAFEQCQRLFHQQIATFIINTMGFNMPISDCKKGVVYSSLLSGDTGYLEIEVPKKAVLVNPKKKN
ncbi:phosphoethanolamine transferase [Actinobacillus equuli]|uniref:Sulfatase n=1 Tax=Actinobacillus equuli TaxID=718 RepID=A0AAX3FPG7_ACTEU|nr:sulfatase-like hydrolase/transferase [Actinobacillus equuli]WGE44801.1 sulfatase-like hydrolase/transferase [Actinobacillus equuli subsp. equuli]VEE92534.1 sulfatase [Actinobacillus equuli]